MNHKAIVYWQSFTQMNGYEVHCGTGRYLTFSRDFDDRTAADGFAQALRLDPSNRSIEVRPIGAEEAILERLS